MTFWSRGGYTTGMLTLKNVMRRMAGRKLPPPGQSKARTEAFQKTWITQVWMNLSLLDLVWIYGGQLRVLEALGRPVICDRYMYDTLVDFKMRFGQLNPEKKLMWRLLVGLAARPDAAFLFELDPVEAEVRSIAKGDPYPEPLEERVRRADFYRELAGEFTVVSAEQLPDEIFRAIEAVVFHN